MTKVKYIIIFFIIIALLLVIPNVSNAATEYTYSDTEQGIEWSYQLDDSNNVIELKCETTDKTGAVTIPSTIDGKTVISLKGGERGFVDEYGAFDGCSGITSVTIPNTITVISAYAFYGCTGLQSITLPDSIIEIGNDAFDDCSGIREITWSNSLTSIGAGAFEGCASLENVTFPDSLIEIGNSAFRDCSGIREITWSNNLTSIGYHAFYGCENLESVILPNSVTTIGVYAFQGCRGLTTLILSRNLTTITGHCFAFCSGLTSVILPDSVTAIEESAFFCCYNLEKILIPDSVASIGERAFGGCDKLTIYGNDGMASKEYAAANDIPFDYIANWDSGNPGTDITGPSVKCIQVEYDSVKDYFGTNKEENKLMYTVPTGVELVINVEFSEAIEATEVPVLTIKFGEGENIQLTEGTLSGDKITYSYTVKSTDKGVMETVDLVGGDIEDASGNAATLTCPTLGVGVYLGTTEGEYVYANGTIVNPDNGDNNDDNDNDGNNNENNNNDANNNDTDTSKKEDNTTATGKLPQTGLTMGMTLAIVVVLAGCVFAYFKYSKLKGI